MITKSTQSDLAKPPMSWLRKMSANTVISSQIQMKNMKNQSIDQNTWPVPNSLAIHLRSLVLGDDCTWRLSICRRGRRRIIPPG